MLIKSIYKGKKNLFVVETFNPTDNVYFEVFEYNLKLRQFNQKRYLKEIKKDYLKTKFLRPITYQEFETEFKKVYENVLKKFNSLYEKFSNYADEVSNAEYRHFMYEYNLNNSPMLSEGLLKILAYSNKALKLADAWNSFVKEYTTRFELEIEVNIDIPQKLNKFREIIDYGFTTATVSKGEYVFDFEVSDELPLDEEDEDETPREGSSNTQKGPVNETFQEDIELEEENKPKDTEEEIIHE